MHELARCTICSTLLALISCRAPIDPTPREHGLKLPDAWTADGATSGTVRDAWWQDFGDPQLTHLVELSFAHNRNLASAAARLAAAVGRARRASAEIGPTIDATFGPRRERQNFVGLPIPGSANVLSTTFSTFGLGLNIGWEVDLWGRIRAGELRSQHELEAAAADFRGARLSLAAQTVRGWFAVVEARAQVGLAEDTARSFRESADRIRSRFERGVRPSLDLRLARSEVETAEASVAQRRNELQRVSRALQVLTGAYPDGNAPESVVLPTFPGPAPAGVPAEVLARRPDLVAAERRLASADANLGQARAALYPALSLTATGGTRSDDVGDLLDGDFRVWSIAGNVLAPIVDWGRRRADIEVSDALRHEAYAAWAGAVLDALSEVEGALAAEQYLAVQERHLEAAAREAAAARTLSEDRYARGLVDVITLLTAQRSDVTAQSQLLAIRRARLDVRVDLMLALGGGFDLSAPKNDSTDDNGS